MSSDLTLPCDLVDIIPDIHTTEPYIEDINLNSLITTHSNPPETPYETTMFDFLAHSLSNDSDSFPDIDGVPLVTSALTSVSETYQYLKDAAQVFPSIEQADTTFYSRNDDEQSVISKAYSGSLPISRTFPNKSNNVPISLSSNVHVIDSGSRRLLLVNPIEEFYRARYKSDYFPQTGSVRHPRYIADREQNHYITIQFPSVYHSDLANKYIRIALITISIDGHGHYYSPYKFQKDHTDINIPDENPIYMKVETSQESKFQMRLQLVLIKSKLDQLNYVQPLKRFSDTDITIQNIIQEKTLSPKELINQYQLDKSHIAFTLCTKHLDGTYEPDLQTTVISSVISEVSTAKKTNENPATTTSTMVDSDHHFCCPQCAHHFDVDSTSGSNKSNKRQSNQCSTVETATTTKTKKRKKTE